MMRSALPVLLLVVVWGLGRPAAPVAHAAQTAPAPLVIVWVAQGDLYLWRQDDPLPRTLATGGVIAPYLSPDARHVAFTRGAQGDARSLWAVATDGIGEQELVSPDLIPSLRGGHPQIAQVGWLDPQTVYFNTLQQRATGDFPDDNLYRVALDGNAQLILPPGAGGAFALSPDGEQIALVSAGLYDTVKGRVTLLDPLGVRVSEKLTFTALRAPSEAALYPPLSWAAEGAYVRVPIPSRDTERVPLWRVPVEEDAQIFGYVSADPAGLPVWTNLPDGAADQMVYLQAVSPDEFDLMLADANGENAETYASGPLADPRWLPGSEWFIYADGAAVWLGKRGEAPRRLFEAGAIARAGTWIVAVTDEGLLAHNAATGERLLLAGLVPVRYDAGVLQ